MSSMIPQANPLSFGSASGKMSTFKRGNRLEHGVSIYLTNRGQKRHIDEARAASMTVNPAYQGTNDAVVFKMEVPIESADGAAGTTLSLYQDRGKGESYSPVTADQRDFIKALLTGTSTVPDKIASFGLTKAQKAFLLNLLEVL